MMNLGKNRLPLWSGCWIAVLALLVAGCAQAPYKESVRLGALVDDALTDGSTSGEMKGGTLTREGWKPGATGMLKYELPGMSQGVISFDVKGLTRKDDASVFLTLFETAQYDFPTPYVTQNPFLASLSAHPYDESPDTTFSFLWTVKPFPQSTPMETVYSDATPEEGAYEETATTGDIALYPAETHSLTITWSNGVARLIVDGEEVASHVYRPMIYTPDALSVVFGMSPGGSPLSYDDLTISNIEIDYPGV